ncbi:hypothetical protein AGABI1DRAFT_88779 [Agaricus bisporus var. burnettii JB137-S8]|uniref:Uncharacterized protein n=2 Tax=Agaricus bisporus TaxID=5341 RepID=K5X7R6_AGABU|nr:uncharacterized protein AGABI1DRAFT_88779 [Agaricus bisporus var. burnettii JB137-S8]EKM83961.1 hypothetical protein AGABI1DRAFT_88779 [Agaricus bisporus var. burnettii JB137-S8]
MNCCNRNIFGPDERFRGLERSKGFEERKELALDGHGQSLCSDGLSPFPPLCTPLDAVSTTSTRRSALTPEPPTPEDEAELEAASATSPHDPENDLEEDVAGDGSRGLSYKRFLSTIGAQYKYAQPNNWLGGDVPFPMNPSFRPPPPISDAIRQEIYNQFMTDPVENSVRKLAIRYTLAFKRVDAILRLKGLEHSWYKVGNSSFSSYVKLLLNASRNYHLGLQENKQIQYGFQKGMEKLLGVTQRRLSRLQEDASRWNVTEADSLEQDENRDAQRQRYQQHYWESVPENGREPIVPASLEHARNLAQKLVKVEDRQKSTHPLLMPRFKHIKHLRSPRRKFRTLNISGRPPVEIRDVGGKFLDVKDKFKRIAATDRQPGLRIKKHQRRQAKILETKLKHKV